MHVFPADMIDVEPLLVGLAEQGLIQRYEVNGARYISIPNFLKHQRPHQNEHPSQIPAFHEEPKLSTKVQSACDQGAKHSALNPSSLNPESCFLNPLPTVESARARTATRLPENFSLTPERRLVAEAEKLPADRVFAKFCDHWRSASGARARKVDWDATWRNWCRNETDRNGASNGTGKSSSQPRISALERQRRATEAWLAEGEASGGGGVVIDG
jgi:hypothetical protein